MVTETQPRRTGNLPSEQTSFVGRSRELTEIERLLAGARLVTLSGVGGVGKSRLALRVATRRQRSFRNGVWLVELASVRDPDLVGHTVAKALNIGEQSGREPLAMLADFLRGRQLLILLDNCEHLPDACAVLTERLLHAAGELKILATSRQSLGVSGEHVWLVPPLSAAAKLFAERAVSVQPRFAMTPETERDVARICHRLDGIPLAIELAAVWLATLSLPQLAAQLDDRFGLLTSGSQAELPHHQTLRAAVEWSYDLCTARQRLLWARASVFPGGIDLAAAEAVCAGGELAADDVLQALDALVDKSVLVREERAGRVYFGLLETLREYGLERLREAGEEAELRRRHSDYYAAMAGQLDAHWFGPDQLDWFGRLQAEHGNLRAALEYCFTQPGEARAGLAMVGNLWFYWIACGQLSEGRHWLDRALAADPEPSLERAGALAIGAHVIAHQGDPEAAAAMAEQGRQLAGQLGDANSFARATLSLGIALFHTGDIPGSMAACQEMTTGFAELQVPDSMAPVAELAHAQITAMTVEPERGIDMCAQVCRSSAAVGEEWVSSWATFAAANALWLLGRPQEATTQARECLRAKWRFADALGISVSVELLAWIAAAAGEFERAATLLGVSDTTFELFGLPALTSQHRAGPHKACEKQTRAKLGDAAFDRAFRTGAAFELEEAIGYALGSEPAIAAAAAVDDPQSTLTGRELQVAELVARGLSNKQIAANLVIAQRTAEAHVEHILTKLGFSSRTQIATWFTAYGQRSARRS